MKLRATSQKWATERGNLIPIYNPFWIVISFLVREHAFPIVFYQSWTAPPEHTSPFAMT